MEIQHHHAHAAACLAEHGFDSGLALVFDGTGMGTDGDIWGAELLDVDTRSFVRAASFAPVPLPGGDAAVMHPARQLVARWVQAGIDVDASSRRRLGISSAEVDAWTLQCRKAVNAPLTHACGRVFDSFSALLGIAPRTITYEGQAAIRLEAVAARCQGPEGYEVPFTAREADGMLMIDWQPAFELQSSSMLEDGNQCEWAMGFHRAVARAALMMIEYGISRSDQRVVALTGGVFMNRVLTELLVPMIEQKGVTPLVHSEVPPNDACVSLGQALIAGTGSEP
jgi:hydrogenase maturation protein HypF